MKTLRNILITMRPQQWVKNTLVFAALFFQPEVTGGDPVMAVVRIFIGFCLISSCVYIFNDIADRERDRFHPEKSLRPIASGELAPSSASVAGVVLLALGFATIWGIGSRVTLLVAMYLCLNIAYSAYLKNVVIIDAFMIATGFVLRVVAGAEAISAPISHWIVLCTVLGSFFLTFSKRRHEVSFLDNAKNHRASLSGYDTYFLDQMIAVTTAGTVMAYTLWTRDPETVAKFGHELVYTIPFVCFGIFRYLYIVHRKKEGGDPSRIFLSDVPLVANILLWGASVVWLVYLKGTISLD